MTQLSRILTAEVSAYLEVVDTIRSDGSEPSWKSEADETRDDLWRMDLSRHEIRAQCKRATERDESQ